MEMIYSSAFFMHNACNEMLSRKRSKFAWYFSPRKCTLNFDHGCRSGL